MRLEHVDRRNRWHIAVLYALVRQRSEEADPYVPAADRALPSWESHVSFVQNHPFRFWYLILGEWDVVAGYISSTWTDELGVVMFREHRRKGYASAALAKVLSHHSPTLQGTFTAQIHPENVASIALFERAGFRHIRNSYALRREHASSKT